MKKSIRALFLTAFMAILILPLCLTNTEEGAVSDTDGRLLAAKPAAVDESFPASAELWLRDRLGFRDEIYAADEAVHDSVFGELISPTYSYGKNGYTFFKMHDNKKYDSYHRSFVKLVADMQEYCESRGTRFYYVFDPEKESLYRDQLPEGVNYNDEWVDTMLDEMKSEGVKVVDLRETLSRAGSDAPVFDRKNDAGHWNQNGAYLGMREITKRMHEDDPGIPVLDKKEYEITSYVVPKMYSSLLPIDEEVPSYTPAFGLEDVTGNIGPELKPPVWLQIMKNGSEEASGIDRMLLLHDNIHGSFAFARAKETVSLSCFGNTTSFDYYYNIFRPDVVVLETMEYVIDEEYFSQQLMDEEDWNPSVIKLFPEKSFGDRREALVEKTPKGRDDISAVLLPGKEIDRVFISSVPEGTKYAYLLTDDSVTDLIRNEHGAYTAGIRHGELEDGDKVYLYITDGDGGSVCSRIDVTTKLKSIETLAEHTDNIRVSEISSRCELSDPGANNRLSYTALSLYNSDASVHIADLASSGAAGIADTAYCHEEETGDYRLMLSVGGNLWAESIQYDVHLTKGETYWVSYDIEKMSPGRVIISGLSFSEAGNR